MSLAPKIDEVRYCAQDANLDLICLTETWLQSHIEDNAVSINGFNLVRKDRQLGVHGGICVFVKNSIPFIVLDDLIISTVEVLWIELRPKRLPRGVNSIILGTVYHPPNSNDTVMLEYLMDCLSSIESQYPNSGTILLGDFNKLKIARIKRSYNLKQIVNFPTRGPNTLDLILTNLKDIYEVPIKRPPFGLSDHFSVELHPKAKSELPPSRIKVKLRDLRPSKRSAIRSYLELVNVPTILNNATSCEGKVFLLGKIIQCGLESIIPLKSKSVYLNEPPWMNPTLKKLIKSRQKALEQGNVTEFRRLRNKVNRKRKSCRSKYYKAKVKHLKEYKPSLWWKEVKKLGGMTSLCNTYDDITKSLKHIEDFSNASTQTIANAINTVFLAPMHNLEPLPYDALSKYELTDSPFSVTSDAVYLKLSSLNPTKAHGPDEIPTWLIKENADLLADPVRDILNCSYREGRLPKQWKKADIIPVPKKKPICDVNKHLRPISLTPILSKIGEDFVVEKFIKPAVLKVIDNNQFGTVPKSSTTQALISMLHKWNKETDGTGSTVRVVLFDFKKAFDLIDHNVLIEKLSKLDLPPMVMSWITDFLQNRKQRVKLSNDCYSEWGNIPAGVPQGTKLGPWLFTVMINDLEVTGVDLWKFVDDTTLSETICRHQISAIQDHVDDFTKKSHAYNFVLNEEKCKEMRISFRKTDPSFDPVVINDKSIELVESVKILGLNISNDLKWKIHISEIVRKVSS